MIVRDLDLTGEKLGAIVESVVADTTPPNKYGLLTAHGHRAHLEMTGEILRVFLDGEDVTNECVEADDRQGFAVLFVRTRERLSQLVARGAWHVGGSGHQLHVPGVVAIAPGGKVAMDGSIATMTPTVWVTTG